METCLWHRRRVHRVAFLARGTSAGRCRFRGRRLSRNSRDDGYTRREPCQCIGGFNVTGIGRCRRRQPVRHSVCESQKGEGHHNSILTGEGRRALEAGADQVIDYKKENVGERVMDITGKRGVDAVIELDLTTNAKLIPSVLRPKGTVVVYGTGPEAVLPAAFCLVNSIRLQFFLVYELDATERERAVSDINDALKSRMLVNRLAHPTFSLAQTAAAHEAVERGSIGNVILVF